MSHKDQSGFIMFVEIVVTVLVLVALGFIGWRVYESHFSNQNSATAPGNQSPKPPASTDQNTYLDIKELGIKLNVNDPSIKDLVYTYTNQYGIDYLHFSTTSVTAADSKCSPSNDPLGTYTVYTSQQSNPGSTDNQAGTLVTHINGFYIYYHHAQFVCSDSAAATKAIAAYTPLLTAVQNAQSDNRPTTITEYFPPANISFTHNITWIYDDSGLTYGFAGHPNEKLAQLNLSYKSANDSKPSRYSIDFISDSYPPPHDQGQKGYTLLGQVVLGSQTLYILHAVFLPIDPTWPLDEVLTSGCPDKECDTKLDTIDLYFYVRVGKGIQNGVPMDSSMLPAITTILESMRLGKS